MTRPPSVQPGAPGPSPEDPEVADLVRQVASRWSMPPARLGAPTWRDRTAGRRGRPWGRLLVPAVVAAAAVVVVAMGAALLGGRAAPDDASPAASGAAVAQASPAASPASLGLASPRASAPAIASLRPVATPLPAYAAPAGPVSDLSVGAIAEDGWHVIDMTTGAGSDAIARPDGSGSALFALADGTYLCACAAFEGRDARSLRLILRRYDALGRPGDEVAELGYDAGSPRAPGAGGAPPVSISPSISADGTRVAVGWTAWDGAFWRSGVDIVDVTPGRRSSGYALTSFDLPRVPGTLDASVELPARWAAYAGSGKALSAWAPMPSISPDGRMVVARRSLVTDGAIVRTDWFVGPAVPLSTVEPAAPFGASGDPTHAPCAEGDVGDADWTAAGVFSIVCSTESASSVLRYDATGRDLGAVDLAPETGGGTWPAMTGTAVADVPSGTYYLWEPFTRRLVAVDTMAGSVARSTTIDPGATGDAGLLEALGALAGRFVDALVPAAHAKVYLAPAVALAPDGRTLYLLTTSATSFESGGAGSLGVIVVGASDLVVRDRWAPRTDLRSIAVSADGRYVLAAGAPGVDASGAEAPWEASITAWDAATGEVSAIAGRLGATWVELVQPLRGD